MSVWSDQLEERSALDKLRTLIGYEAGYQHMRCNHASYGHRYARFRGWRRWTRQRYLDAIRQ
jgi:hypothetical protein